MTRQIRSDEGIASHLRAQEGAGILSACDGQELKRLFAAGTAWLERHSEAINALNVFPVPDGDTGTNMLLTMQAALNEVDTSPDHSAATIARYIAHGALMGARGNSGVILSQILRGIAATLDNKESFDSSDFAAAIAAGSDVAYQGVIEPVEGTILTVVRKAAEAAVAAASRRNDLVYVLEETVAAARDSVVETQYLLDVLEEAGVVDAGGQGLLVILEGMLRLLKGEAIVAAASSQAIAAPPTLEAGEQAMTYGYCTEFIIQGRGMDLEEVRGFITTIGDSALVVGDEYLIRVHVHTFNPGRVLEYATSQGVLHKIKIDNMQDQHQHFLDLTHHEALPAQAVEEPTPAEELANLAVVAVAPGKGLERVFKSLGASAIVSGGQTMNPSTEELLRAIESMSADHVIVLPNNKNVVMAAQQTQPLSSKHVVVVPTKTVPQGIAAMLALNYQADAEANAQAMERATRGVQTAEVTRAVRPASINGLQVTEGDTIGLLNGDLTTSGHDITDVVLDLLSGMPVDDYEVVTVYYGEDVSRAEAEALGKTIEERFPDQEVEVIDGGQPHYFYILSAE